MAAGILRIQSFEARRSAPAAGVTVTITGQGFSASRLTDDTGNTQDLEIDAPDQALSLEEDNTTIQPYAVCDLVAEKPGFETIHIEGVQIFAGQVTLAPLEMTPANARVTPPSQSVVIPPHSLFAPGGGSGPGGGDFGLARAVDHDDDLALHAARRLARGQFVAQLRQRRA